MKPDLKALRAWVDEASEKVLTQDNACTAHPVFLVQQKRRIYGMDPEYGTEDSSVWLYDDDCTEPDEYLQCALDAYYEAAGKEPEGFRRVHFMDTMEFVQAFLTHDAAKMYIAMQKHNLNEPVIYVDSANRNLEWQCIRKLFVELPELLRELESFREQHTSTSKVVVRADDENDALVIEATVSAKPTGPTWRERAERAETALLDLWERFYPMILKDVSEKDVDIIDMCGECEFADTCKVVEEIRKKQREPSLKSGEGS